jgi:hypothetical protein
MGSSSTSEREEAAAADPTCCAVEVVGCREPEMIKSKG